MRQKLIEIQEQAILEIGALESLETLFSIKSKYLGKKSVLTQVLKDISSLPVNERADAGKQANEIKKFIQDHLDKQTGLLEDKAAQAKLQANRQDLSLPGWKAHSGHYHLLYKEMKRIEGIFTSLGYSVLTGPEIESDWYNFEALNIPKNHPARDMHDTFYTQSGKVLRTHTSPVQIRALETYEPPLKIIVPGRVFRCDADVTHSPVFHQCEGLYVCEKSSVAELKGTLDYFCKQYFGANTQIRFRSSYFPFTEPSFEVDVSYQKAGKPSQWMEVLGAGMVHPNVLKAVGLDPEAYQGFAFGLGVDRLAMLAHKIYDIRLLYQNDLRFNGQFGRILS